MPRIRCAADGPPAGGLDRSAEVRARRELVRHRHKLVQLATCVKAQVHAGLAKCGVPVVVSDLFGVAGSARLRPAVAAGFPRPAGSQLRLLTAIDAEIDRHQKLIRAEFKNHVGYKAIQRIDGSGRSWRRCSLPSSAT